MSPDVGEVLYLSTVSGALREHSQHSAPFADGLDEHGVIHDA